MTISQKTLNLAKILWDYHLMNEKLRRTDVILALGSDDIRIADRVAELYFDGYAPLVIFSGGRGRLTPKSWKNSEAEELAKRAVELGVPKDDIIIEPNSSNTGENIKFSKKILEEKGIHPKSLLLVHLPYMERRAYATFKKEWPNKEIVVTSPQISFEDYPNETIPIERVINRLVGYVQRIKEYPKLGFQIEQKIPKEVLEAYKKLVGLGYDKALIGS
jgi:uncharacterized SAM-binding protein YcdF (DUF218 family)